VINFLAGGRSGGSPFTMAGKSRSKCVSKYPPEGQALFDLHTPQPRHVQRQNPASLPGAASAAIQINGRPLESPVRPGEYAVLRREWRDADRITLDVPLKPRLLAGDHTNRGKIAFAVRSPDSGGRRRLEPRRSIAASGSGSTNLEKLALRRSRCRRIAGLRMPTRFSLSTPSSA